MTEAEIQQIWEDNDFPSQVELYKLVTRKGLKTTNDKIKNFLKTKLSNQVLRAQLEPYRIFGKFASTRASEKIYADLIDFSSRPDGEYKYILAVVDSFTKQGFLEPMKSKTQDETVDSLMKIIPRLPGVKQPELIFTDKDAAFGIFNSKINENSKFHKTIEDGEEIIHKLKAGRNDIAPVDNFIFQVKQRLAKIRLEAQQQGWASLVPRVEKSLNNKPRKALMGSSAKDVETNRQLEFKMLQQQSKNLESNFAEDSKMREKLKPGNGFRAPTNNRELVQNRADVARYEPKVRIVDKLEGDKVIDTEGNAFTAKLVLPVDKDSTQADIVSETRDPRRIAMQRGVMEKYVQPALTFIGNRSNYRALGQFLNRDPNFKTDLLKAGIRGDKTISIFVNLFPEKFKIEPYTGGAYIYKQSGPKPSVRLRTKQPLR